MEIGRGENFELMKKIYIRKNGFERKIYEE
jgi:hypothetical protein